METIQVRIRLLQDIELIEAGGVRPIYSAGSQHYVTIIKGKKISSVRFSCGFEIYGVQEGVLYEVLKDEDVITLNE